MDRRPPHPIDIRRAQPADGAGAPAAPRQAQDLHVCTSCASELVQPVSWAPCDRKRWRVRLRCPECGLEAVGVFSQPSLDRYEAILESARIKLLETVAHAERESLDAEIERFRTALEQAQALPDDP